MQQLFFLFVMTLAVTGIITITFIASGIKVLKEWDRAVVLRLGRFYGIKGPGIIWTTPIIDKIVKTISLRLQKYELTDKVYHTQESMEVKITGTVCYRVVDTIKAATSVEDERQATMMVIEGVILDFVRSSSYDDLFMDGSTFCEKVKENINQATDEFGMKVTDVDLYVDS